MILVKTCWMRKGSPTTLKNWSFEVSMETVSLSSEKCEPSASKRRRRSNVSSSSSTPPMLIFAMSKMSSMIFRSWFALSHVPSTSANCSSSMSVSCKKEMLPMMPFRGFLISWHRNCSCSIFASLAASSANLIFFMSSFSCLVVTSCAKKTTPSTVSLVVRRAPALTSRFTTPLFRFLKMTSMQATSQNFIAFTRCSLSF
mmetsp:Transcript_38264/g.120466  ORF Transcript_38264/g.120466 Transcript_38264/m.120466 type:complete len:200 (-) Transcript_38264:2395-2994(-)